MGLNADGVWGPLTDAKAFSTQPTTPPATQWPTTGRNATTRPTADIQKLVGLTGSQVDGDYGPITSQAVAQWQSAHQLTADGIWGPASDRVGFPGVPLPDAQPSPDTDPSYGKKIPTYPGSTWADVSPNKSVRDGKVQLFIVHHRADTGDAASARLRFMTANDRNVSPNWNINQDGSVDEIVPPDNYRAWTTGQIDHQAVTVETGNTSGDPNWGISQASMESIAKLIAWAAKRYSFPIQHGAAVMGSDGKNVVTVPGVVAHRETPAGKETGTVCPGPSMNMDWIINRAKDIYTQNNTQQPPVDPGTPSDKILVDRKVLENIQAELAAGAEVIGEILS